MAGQGRQGSADRADAGGHVRGRRGDRGEHTFDERRRVGRNTGIGNKEFRISDVSKEALCRIVSRSARPTSTRARSPADDPAHADEGRVAVDVDHRDDKVSIIVAAARSQQCCRLLVEGVAGEQPSWGFRSGSPP
jgi:hypothetical protein